MAVVAIPHYFDVAVAVEKAALEMSRDAGLGLSVSPNRYLLPLQKRLEFAFRRLGDKKWQLRISVEKVGGQSDSSAFRVQLGLPTGGAKEETVYLMNEEQMSDLALRYAETITSLAAEDEPVLSGSSGQATLGA